MSLSWKENCHFFLIATIPEFVLGILGIMSKWLPKKTKDKYVTGKINCYLHVSLFHFDESPLNLCPSMAHSFLFWESTIFSGLATQCKKQF